MKVKIAKVKFLTSNRIYYFSTNNLELKKGDEVIVESDKGIQFAFISSEPLEIDNSKISSPLKNVIRIATEKDRKINKKNIEDSTSALKKARKLSDELKLNMTILSAYFTFDRNQLIFSFLADDRIDFRELAKKLASIYKTRIELRQIGVRDKAKEIGGLGPCGRYLCCNLFLNEFESVSINMAKNQYISLKPDKINGICGRLLCCLNYEDNQYTELKKQFPAIGSILKYNGERAKVISHNLFKESFVIEKSDKTQVTLSLDEYESIK